MPSSCLLVTSSQKEGLSANILPLSSARYGERPSSHTLLHFTVWPFPHSALSFLKLLSAVQVAVLHRQGGRVGRSFNSRMRQFKTMERAHLWSTVILSICSSARRTIWKSSTANALRKLLQCTRQRKIGFRKETNGSNWNRDMCFPPKVWRKERFRED
jgi:hypothetical protein